MKMRFPRRHYVIFTGEPGSIQIKFIYIIVQYIKLQQRISTISLVVVDRFWPLEINGFTNLGQV